MKKIVLKIIVLLAVFVGGVFLFGVLLNQETMENSRDLEAPTLPVLCIDYEGYKINRMYGHVEEMDQNSLRDGLVPLTTNRDVRVSIKSFNSPIDSVTYEVTSLVDGAVVENAKVGNFKEDGDYQTAGFTLQEPILMNQEYGLKFTVHTGDQDIYYYTRVVQRSSLNTSQYVEFAYNFYEKCMNREGASDLNTYLETPEVVTNNSYTNIDIHSSFNQITWGSLKPKIYRKAVASIKEINENTGSIVMEYMISAENEDGDEELYYVTDFFRMRYFQSKIMLLDFYRDTQQIFDGNLPVISTKGVELGIAGKDVSYVTNESATIAAFVQAGELWTYNSSADKLSRAFSMRSGNEGDERDDYQENNIKIIRVEESGDIDFAVYGYMNKDVHEGQVGVSVCRYSSERNTVEEKIFIPSDKSYELLEEDLQRLCYVNKQEDLYLYLNDIIFRVHLPDKTQEVLLDQVNPDCLAVSKDQGQIAWMNEMQEYASPNITVMNLETKERRSIKAGDGSKARVLGFINEDFIYGIASDGDIYVDTAGNTIFAMNDIRIEDAAGTLVKEYKNEGVWVSKVNIQEGLIELERVVRAESGYAPTTTDNIMNNQPDEGKTVEVRTSNTTRRGTVVTLVFSDTITNRSPLLSLSKLRVQGEQNTVNLEMQKEQSGSKYYVYAKGKLDSIYTKPSEAVIHADSQVGIVLNRSQQYVWERGNNQTENELNNQDIPEAFLSATLDEQAIGAAMGDFGEVINLTGCTLEEVLYQLSADRAVMARQPDGTAALLVGYNRYNTLWYDFNTGEHIFHGMNDSTNLFAQAGNVFLSYVEKPKTGGN